MTVIHLSVVLGVSSMLLFQVEQELKSWLENFKQGRPYYDGNFLILLARAEQKLRAHNKTIARVTPFIGVARWVAIITGVASLVLSGCQGS